MVEAARSFAIGQAIYGVLIIVMINQIHAMDSGALVGQDRRLACVAIESRLKSDRLYIRHNGAAQRVVMEVVAADRQQPRAGHNVNVTRIRVA